MFRGRHEPIARLRELRLPKPEREAARAERLAERQLRLERDNAQSAERRAAALQAASDKDAYWLGRR